MSVRDTVAGLRTQTKSEAKIRCHYPYRFRFADQLIPAGISIASNIAERSRRPTKAYLSHLSFSLGSHAEVETLFELIRGRNLVPIPLLAKGVALVEPLGTLLHGLAASLQARLNSQSGSGTPNPQSPIPIANP